MIMHWKRSYNKLVQASGISNVDGESPNRNRVGRYRRKPSLDERGIKIERERHQVQREIIRSCAWSLLWLHEQGQDERITQQIKHSRGEGQNTDEESLLSGCARRYYDCQVYGPG